MGIEKNLQTKILQDLESMDGVLPFKLEKANINGLADVWFIYRNGVACVEVKKPGKEPEPHQRLLLNRINAIGGARAYWCNTWERWIEIKTELFS